MSPESSGPTDTSWSSTSTSLIRRVRAQDPEAWNQLVDIYLPKIFYWCRKYKLQEQDTRDVSQDVFIAVATHIATFKHNKSKPSFRPWLREITRNRIISNFRSAGNRPDAAGGTEALRLIQQAPDLQLNGSSASSNMFSLGDEQLMNAIEEVRGRTTEPTWQAFWRTTVLAQAPYFVAAELGMPLNSVHKAKSRILQNIRQELKKQADQK